MKIILITIQSYDTCSHRGLICTTDNFDLEIALKEYEQKNSIIPIDWTDDKNIDKVLIKLDTITRTENGNFIKFLVEEKGCTILPYHEFTLEGYHLDYQS